MDYKENAILSTIFNSKLPSIFLLLLLIINIGSVAYAFDFRSSQNYDKPVSVDIVSIQTKIEISSNHILNGYNSIEIIDSSDNKIKEEDYKSDPRGGITLDVPSLPVFEITPGNVSFNKHETGKLISWTIKENKPDIYVIYQDGIQVESGPWTDFNSPVPLTYDIDYLDLGLYNITIVVNDTEPEVNYAQDTAWIEILDGPQFTSTPSDNTIVYGSTDNTFEWIATASSPDKYEIFRDLVLVQSGFWTSASIISADVDGLPVGVYIYDIEINDTNGFIIQDSVTLIVYDENNPIITVKPSNFTVSEGLITESITWKAIDDFPTNYDVYQDGVIVQSATWVNATDVIHILDTNLTPGLYNFTIQVMDISANYAIDTVWVTVVDDTNPIFTSSPNDFSYEVDTTGHSISWTVTDKNPGNYTFYRDEIIFDEAFWISGTPISYIIDGLVVGIHNFTIMLTDLHSNVVQQTVLVTITDSIIPEFTSTPGDITYSEGTTNNKLQWVVTDAHPNQLTIYRDGIEIISSGWLSGALISIVIDGLSQGIYNYTITISDLGLNIIKDTSFVTVTDTIDPEFTSIPEDLSYSIGTTGHELEWIGWDSNPFTYVIYNNGTIQKSGTWGQNVTIAIPVDGLAEGTHNFTIVLEDTSGNQAIDMTWVTVGNVPVFTSIPDDLTYVVTNTSNNLGWTMSDSDPDMYIVYLDEVAIYNDTWDNAIEILVIVDGLSLGEYNYTIWVNDTAGNYVVDTAWVTVADIPSWDSRPNDGQYAEGTPSFLINWNATDTSNDTYIVKLNGTFYNSSTWNNAENITIDVGGLAKGTYNFSIQVTDIHGYSIYDWVLITVFDDKKPENVDPPPDFEYIEGSIDNIIYWNFTDNYPNNYFIYRNGTEVLNGTWTNENFISLNIDGLVKGPYNYIIVVFDDSGNSRVDTVIIKVVDNTDPKLDYHTPDYTYPEGIEGNVLIWNVTDLYPNKYTIFLDNVEVVPNTSWSNYTSILININGLDFGLHNYTIYITDQSLNQLIDVIYVFVTEVTEPILQNLPTVFIYPENTTSIITWSASDAHPGNYSLYLDGKSIINDFWVNETNIPDISLNLLLIGTHIFTIFFNDTSGNFVSDTVFITITDDIIPKFTLVPDPIFEFNESIGYFLIWNAFELHPDFYEIYVDGGSPIVNTTWNSDEVILLNLDGFAWGSYNVTIIIYDKSGNFNSSITNVIVYDIIYPEITSTPNRIIFQEGALGSNIAWVITDLHPLNYILDMDGFTVGTGFWLDKTEINYILPDLDYGEYNFTLTVFDETGNSDAIWGIITIEDTTDPVVLPNHQQIGFQVSEGVFGTTAKWNATDRHAYGFEIYYNGSLQQTGTWISGIEISVDIDNLSKGFHNISISIFDVSRNEVIYYFILKVIDTSTPSIEYLPEEDITLNETSSARTIWWNFTDNYPSHYQILIDSELFRAEVWQSSEAIEIILQNLLLGTYNYTIIVWDESGNFISHSLQVFVNDVSIPIFLSSPGDEVILILSDVVGNFISWNVTDTHPNTYSIFKNELLVFSSTWINRQTISFNTDDLSIGTHNITLVVTDTSNNVAIDTAIIRIKDPVVADTTIPVIDISRNVYEGDLETFEGIWFDINQTEIGEADIFVTLRSIDRGILEYSVISFENGTYTLLFNYTSLLPGDYVWEIEFSKYLFHEQTVPILVTIHPHSFTIVLETLPVLVNGEEFQIGATVSYDNSYDFGEGSLGLRGLIPKEGKVVGVQVTITINYIIVGGESDSRTFKRETNENGYAVATLGRSDTLNIVSIESITAGIIDDPYGITIEQNLEENSFPRIEEEEKSLSEKLREFLFDNLFIIIFVILAIVGLFVFRNLASRNKKRRNRRLLEELEVAHVELKGLKTIDVVILQTTSGLPLFEKQYERVGVDSYLISGMTSAISAFLTELDSDSMFGFETVERENLSITSHKAVTSTMIVISRKKIPLSLLNQIEKTHIEVQRVFYQDFIGHEGGFDLIEPEKMEKVFIESGFKIELLQKELIIDTSVIKKIQKNEAISRLLRQKLDLFREEGLSQFNNTDHTINLSAISQYLNQQGLSSGFVSSIIFLMYANKGIKIV